MFGKIKIIENIDSKTDEKILDLAREELIKTEKQDKISFHIEFAQKYPDKKITGHDIDSLIAEHKEKLRNAEILIEKGEDTEDSHTLKIIEELVKK